MLNFEKQLIEARFVNPTGQVVNNLLEVRTDPISRSTSRITYARQKEKEPGTEDLPKPPPEASARENCPFCRPQVMYRTPQLDPELFSEARLQKGDSLLFPNLFPYGQYSAVSLIDDNHFVEIGTASLSAYTDSLLNCKDYLKAIRNRDREAVYLAITQNHLPSAGGSLIHPHFQIQADKVPANNQRQLEHRSRRFYEKTGNLLLSAYLEKELGNKERYIGRTGNWQWVAAYAPKGFYEVWGLLPGAFSLCSLDQEDYRDLAQGILNIQKFYRSLNRNGYNLGILAIETEDSLLELRVVLMVRSTYSPWVRNDQTGFEMMLGEMATFNSPEEIADWCSEFFS